MSSDESRVIVCTEPLPTWMVIDPLSVSPLPPTVPNVPVSGVVLVYPALSYVSVD